MLPPPHMKTTTTIPLDLNIPGYIALFHKFYVPGLFPFPEHTRLTLASGTFLTLALFETCPSFPAFPLAPLYWPQRASPRLDFPMSLPLSTVPSLDLWTFFLSATLISIFQAGECLCRRNTQLGNVHHTLFFPLSPPTPQRQHTPSLGRKQHNSASK